MDKFTNILGDVNTPLSVIDRTSRQKNQDRKPEQSINLTWLTLREHSTTAADTYSFQAHMETFTKIDHIQSHKTCLNKFQIIEIV